MSSPISIPRSAPSSASSSSSSGGSPGLYIPVHRRTGSASSRATSPSSPSFPSSIGPHSRIYSPEFLLSLRPNADDGVREKMRSACPEAVMNRRTRKYLEFSQHQHGASERKVHHQQQQPSSPRAAIASLPAPYSAPITAAPVPPRAVPHRNRHAVRAPEQKQQAFVESRFNLNESWSRVAIPLQRWSVV